LKRTKPIRDALIALNFAKIAYELEKQPVTPEVGKDLLQMTRQLGVLAVVFPNAGRAGQRDTFVSNFRKWIGTKGMDDLYKPLDDTERQARLCEAVFHRILKDLQECPTGKLPLDTALWTVLSGIAKDADVVASAATTAEAQKVGSNTVYMSAESLRVEAFGREGLDPDAVVERYADNLAGYLKMNAHKHGLFVEGVLVLPRPVPVPEDVAGDRSPIYFAEIWNQIDGNWGKLRYFPTSDVQLLDAAEPEGLCTLAFSHDEPLFLDIEIARSRLRRQAFEIMMHVMFNPKTEPLIGDPQTESVPLAPHRFLSMFEAVATMVLDICYELNVRSEKQLYLGLSVSQWLRGYALLQWCSDKGIALISCSTGLGKLDRGEFAKLAARAGLPSHECSSFLQNATFGAKSRDLWDTPLIQDVDGELYLLTPLVRSLNLAEALISRLNTLLQQVKSKGPKFEADVRSQFEMLGAKTKQFKYRVGSETFECDAAALWSNILFLNECKAYVLPQPSAEDIHFFQIKLQEAVDQIARVAKHLLDDPTILKTHFAEASTAEETVLCVINQSPFWSQVFGDKVQFFDGRALSKFLAGSIDAVVRSASSKTDLPVAEKALHSLWSGDLPTPADLREQMRGPFQYKNEASMWESVEREIEFMDSMVFRLPMWQRKPDPPLA
jgi:hypothetical protein